MGIPTKEANAQGLRDTKQVIHMIQDQYLPTSAVRNEIALICEETRCILDKIIELGKGDVAQGIIRGFEAGVIDVPFAPSKYNMGKALPARDNDGAVRFMEFGNLPFTDDIKAYHKRKWIKEQNTKNAMYHSRW
jgi:Glutamate mutase epsilon subunit